MEECPLTSECKARDYTGNKRLKHKPTPGNYDGKDATSCAWCGATLEEQ